MDLFQLVIVLLLAVLLSTAIAQLIPRVASPLVQIAIGAIVGVAARGKKKKQVQQTAYAVPAPDAQAAPAPAEAPEEPQKRVCAACGADLAEGEDACPYCGTKA